MLDQLPLSQLFSTQILWKVHRHTLELSKTRKICKTAQWHLDNIPGLVYHPVDNSTHNEFNDVLSMLFRSAPNNSEIISGHDVNANIGIRTEMYKSVIGPHGTNNRNMKGCKILNVFKSHQLKILNSFYSNKAYTNCRSFGKKRSSHNLDILNTSLQFSKIVTDCGIYPYEMSIEHLEVYMTFKLHYIKLNSTY